MAARISAAFENGRPSGARRRNRQNDVSRRVDGLWAARTRSRRPSASNDHQSNRSRRSPLANDEDVDRINKVRDYQRIPSPQEYVLVSQGEPRVEVYRQQDSGNWEHIDVCESVMHLATGPTLDLSALYRDLPD